jgi:hypothetical protein
MATLNLRRFTNYATLTAIRPVHLLLLLEPYKDYFASRGVLLPDEALNPHALPYADIALIMMGPDARMPPDLIEAFYYIHEMASPAGHEAMIEALGLGLIVIKVSEHTTALDLAVQFWLKDRRLLEQLHDEQNLAKPRSFDYFRADREKSIEFKLPEAPVLRRMEADLDRWFVKKQRGRTARVYAYGREGGAWFLVRHGEPFKHESVIQDGESGCIFFRPEKYDVIAYDAQAGEIRINARTKGERDLYRMMFGRHLFGNDHFFGEQSRFTLEPLRRDGRAALMCLDVRGLEYVRLKEIQFFWGGHYNELETHKAEDVFAAIEERRVVLPKGPRVSKATFGVKFNDAKAERTATISSTNRAYYKRDDDGGILETWMRRRGFIIFGEGSAYAAQIVGMR